MLSWAPERSSAKATRLIDQAAGRDDQHRAGRDVRRVGEPADRLDQHEDRDAGEQHGVGQRGEHLEPVEAERALRVGGGPAGGGDRGERHRDAEHVGEHVPGVGEQGQRAGQQRGDRLDHHEAGQQPGGPPEPGAVLARRRAAPGPRGRARLPCAQPSVAAVRLGQYMFTSLCMQCEPDCRPPGYALDDNRLRLERNHPCPDVLSRIVALDRARRHRRRAAAPPRRRPRRRAGRRSPCPDGFQPEGIAIGDAAVRVLRLPRRRRHLPGQPADRPGQGASARAPAPPSLGLKLDGRGRLFVAGGSGGNARVIDAAHRRGAEVVHRCRPAPAFINDVMLTGGAAWYTDSANPVLFKLPLGRHGAAARRGRAGADHR